MYTNDQKLKHRKEAIFNTHAERWLYLKKASYYLPRSKTYESQFQLQAMEVPEFFLKIHLYSLHKITQEQQLSHRRHMYGS